jgi:hypothetical protein
MALDHGQLLLLSLLLLLLLLGQQHACPAVCSCSFLT